MPVIALDAPDVVLPLRAQTVPGLDEVTVVVRQVVWVVQDEGGGDTLGRRGAGAPGGL